MQYTMPTTIEYLLTVISSWNRSIESPAENPIATIYCKIENHSNDPPNDDDNDDNVDCSRRQDKPPVCATTGHLKYRTKCHHTLTILFEFPMNNFYSYQKYD